MLMEDTSRTCVQYLSTSRGGYYPEHRAKIYHILVLQGKIQSTVRSIMEREKGGLFQPGYTRPKTGQPVLEVLRSKHPKARPPTARSLDAYGGKPPAIVTVKIIDATVATVTR